MRFPKNTSRFPKTDGWEGRRQDRELTGHSTAFCPRGEESMLGKEKKKKTSLEKNGKEKKFFYPQNLNFYQGCLGPQRLIILLFVIIIHFVLIEPLKIFLLILFCS
jgi:hypothetical protein